MFGSLSYFGHFPAQVVSLSHSRRFHVRKPQLLWPLSGAGRVPVAQSALPCSEASATQATFRRRSCPCRTVGASMFGILNYFGHFSARVVSLSHTWRFHVRKPKLLWPLFGAG